MLYHKNRLIQRYVKFGVFNTNKGSGVMTILDCPFLTPTHNKQEFMSTGTLHNLQELLKDKVLKYVTIVDNLYPNKEKLFEDIRKEKIYGPFWIQCDKCLKWRSVPKSPEDYPDEWSCQDNIDMRYSDCNIPQEKDKIFPDLTKDLPPPPKPKKEEEQEEEEEGDSQDPPYSHSRPSSVVPDIQQKPPKIRNKKKNNNNNYKSPSNYKTTPRKLPRSDYSDDEYEPTKNDYDKYDEYEEYKPSKRKSSITEPPKKKKISERVGKEMILIQKLSEVYEIFKEYTKKLTVEEINDPSFWLEEWSPSAHFKNAKNILQENQEKNTKNSYSRKTIRTTKSQKRS